MRCWPPWLQPVTQGPTCSCVRNWCSAAIRRDHLAGWIRRSVPAGSVGDRGRIGILLCDRRAHLVDSEQGGLANAAFIFAEGSIQAVADKQLLPGYDVFDEDRYFKPG